MLPHKPFATSASTLRLQTQLLCSVFVLAVSGIAGETALDRYVKTPDPSFKWNAVGTTNVSGVSVSSIEMTSQTWRSAKEVDKPEWKHFINIYKPANAKPGIALLWVDGGNNRGGKPNPSPLMIAIAKDSGMIAAELRQIPSEPLLFAGETKTRSEDGIIAYTWDKYLRGGDDQWPLRLPMTKAGVRAMDTVTAFLKTKEGGELNIDRFIVGGASKRGWTTWTIGAVDKRVIAIAPMVIDLLNMVPSFIHHYRAYGFWAPAIKDYTDMNIMGWLGTKQFKNLMKIEEPYEYRDRLTMPKLIINSAGDDFFLPDSSQFYYNKLQGEKHIRYMPNTRHNLEPIGVTQSLVAFMDSVANNRPRPNFTWKINKSDSSIEVKAPQAPKAIKVWQVTNPKARDFRLTETKATWKSETVALVNGKYTARLPKPATGYTAFFVELIYDSGAKHPHTFTTEVSVVPNTYPFTFPKPVKP
ncbi:MAG: PhoPQ-activated pathogenicity-related family protein [Acidobacteria bacterium]|nr:PhoPQ-activated pathogenicity-related family protein [Acidobacteriota bacterium]